MIIGLITTLCFSAALGCLALAFLPGARADQGAALVKTADVALKPTPIPANWLIEGRPTTEAAEIARTADGTTCVYLWQTTRAIYNWHHASDETVTVVDGEVYLTVLDGDSLGREQRLRVGDASFFPAGTMTRWRVPTRFRKICTLTRPAPWPVANTLRRLRAIKRWARNVPRLALSPPTLARSHAAAEDRPWI